MATDSRSTNASDSSNMHSNSVMPHKRKCIVLGWYRFCTHARTYRQLFCVCHERGACLHRGRSLAELETLALRCSAERRLVPNWCVLKFTRSSVVCRPHPRAHTSSGCRRWTMRQDSWKIFHSFRASSHTRAHTRKGCEWPFPSTAPGHKLSSSAGVKRDMCYVCLFVYARCVRACICPGD